MVSRAEDWYRQARRDLEHARSTAENGFHEWASFSAQQAAEKAAKAVLQRVGASARGHSVRALLEEIQGTMTVATELLNDARDLDRHYIPARYPNSVPEGAPYESYDAEQSKRAIAAAERVVEFCGGHMA